MSKKSKRQSRKTSGQRATIQRTDSKVATAASSADINRPQIVESGSKSRSPRSYETEFNPDYSQTIKDLRRIGTLAGSFFIILIILSFFLR
jgi:hypothetical protein